MRAEDTPDLQTDLLQVRDGLGPQFSSQLCPAQRVELVSVEVEPGVRERIRSQN